MRALVALLLAPVVLASSFPDGAGKASCDAIAKDYYGKGNPIMNWVDAPIRSDDYTVRTGDSTCVADPTTYTPGEYVTIYVRTTRAKRQFRGLLLYAVALKNSQPGVAEDAIGDWEITESGTSSMFFLPQNCKSKAVMHTTAQIKYYVHSFRFKAPAAGTGKIAFRALIKRGEANLGEFYWPMLKGDLVLNEAPAQTRSWYLGGLGATCAATCQAQGLACDAAYMAKMPQLDAVGYKQVSRHYTCNTPLISDCNGPSQDLATGNCAFPNKECPSSRDYCTSAVDSTMAALCACGTVGGPPAVDTQVCQFTYSAGNRVAGSGMLTWALLLATSLFFGRSSRSTILLVLVVAAFVCLPSASAHNWVRSPSRSRNEASTLKPCRNRFDESNPHFQIAPGQTFEIEWATGHDWYFAFVVAKAEDYPFLQNYTEQMIEEYIDGCKPPVCTNQVTLDGGKWEKFQMEPVDSARASYDTQYPGHFAGKADPSISIVRHPRFGNTDVTYWRYIPDYSANCDVRAEYANPKYPWIHAIHRFKMVGMSRPGNADVARFTINPRPAGYQGKYIVNYFWRGYYDCVDVDVFNTPVALVYGRVATPDDNIWARVDHCQFEEIQGIETACKQVITTPQRCLDACTPRQNCLGVNVVPMWNPTTVYHGFQKMMNLPFDGVGMGGMGAGCSRNLFASAPDNTMVCYGVRPRLPNFTHSEYTIVLDPEDPIFYSTCYLKTADWLFDLRLPGFENKPKDTSKTPWAYGPKCISCADRKFVTLSANVPVWKLQDHCRDCDSDPDPPNAGRNSTPIERLATGFKCDGQTSATGLISWDFRGKYGSTPAVCADRTKCVKDLSLLGWADMNEDECIALAQGDSDCSKTVMYRALPTGAGCQCWRNEACCGSCSPNDKAFFNHQWNVLRIGDAVADPTCATGVKSADGQYCCPNSCKDPTTGVAQCMPRPTVQVSFQPSLMVAPAGGWLVDSGELFGTRSGGWSYGWSQAQIASDVIDTYPDDGSNVYSTGIMPGRTATNKAPHWDIGPLANGTYRVEVLYGSRSTTTLTSGCTLEGSRASYTGTGGSTTVPAQVNAWEARDIDVTDGQLTLGAGPAPVNCVQVNAIRIWPKSIVSASGFSSAAQRCDALDGMCCPSNTEAGVGTRPCSQFGPPCSNPSGSGPAPTVPPTVPPTVATTRGPTAAAPPTTAAPAPTTAAPAPTTAAPAPTTAAPAPTVAATRGPTAAAPTTAAPAPTGAPVAPTGAPVVPTTAAPAPTGAPVAPTGAPVVPTTAAPAPTGAPVAPTAAPVAPTAAPI